MREDPARFASVIAEIDAANAADPRRDVVDGESHPRELLYAQRMTACLEKLYPEASEALRIAARAQHIRRWEIPRDSYPSGRAGYNAWRTACSAHHAALAEDIMRRHGYGESEIARVCKLIRKKDLKRDAESQALENVVGTVFVAYYLADFAEKHDEPKLISILRKTGRKMSEEGHRAVNDLDMPPHLDRLLRKALS